MKTTVSDMSFMCPSEYLILRNLFAMNVDELIKALSLYEDNGHRSIMSLSEVKNAVHLLVMEVQIQKMDFIAWNRVCEIIKCFTTEHYKQKAIQLICDSNYGKSPLKMSGAELYQILNVFEPENTYYVLRIITKSIGNDLVNKIVHQILNHIPAHLMMQALDVLSKYMSQDELALTVVRLRASLNSVVEEFIKSTKRPLDPSPLYEMLFS